MEFATGGSTVKIGDAVILSTRSGERYGTVVPDVPSSCGSCTGCATKKDPPKLLRLATEEDRRLYEAKLTREAEAYRSCSMKLNASPTLGTPLFDTCAPRELGARLLAICWRSSDYASAGPSPVRETGGS